MSQQQEAIAEFLRTIESIQVGLLSVAGHLARSLHTVDILALSNDFEHPQETQQARMLLLIVGKLADWSLFEGNLVDVTNPGNWLEVLPKVRHVMEHLEDLLAVEALPASFEHLRLVSEFYLNEFLVRPQNLRVGKLQLLRVFAQQLVLLNIIKQKSWVSQRLIAFFDQQIDASKAAKGPSSTQIKRILHVLISKNFLGDDSASASTSGFMENFNQTFSEIIWIIGQIRDLSHSDTLLGQVLADFPDLLTSNPFFAKYVAAMPQERVDRAMESAAQPPGRLSLDFRFPVHNKVYTVSLDRHSKHKIFYESVAESCARDLLTKIHGILAKIDALTHKFRSGSEHSNPPSKE